MQRDFYASTVRNAVMDRQDSVLVICGGPYDRRTFLDAGFADVVISNLEHHDRVESPYEPYCWEKQDAEALDRPDNSVDWAVVNAGLHHCASPHRAVCEMLRVAKKGILVLEARDSALMRLAVRLGLTVDYELEPIALSGASAETSFGGLRSSFIPNYIYRWTERDVEKAVSSYLPQYVHTYQYFYGLRLPLQRLAMSKNPIKRLAVALLVTIRWVIEALLPRQGNHFAFLVTKKGVLQPWLRMDGERLEVNAQYFSERFDIAKYRKI